MREYNSPPESNNSWSINNGKTVIFGKIDNTYQYNSPPDDIVVPWLPYPAMNILLDDLQALLYSWDVLV